MAKFRRGEFLWWFGVSLWQRNQEDEEKVQQCTGDRSSQIAKDQHLQRGYYKDRPEQNARGANASLKRSILTRSTSGYHERSLA